MKERIQIFIGWIVSLFVSEWKTFDYLGNKVKCNISKERLLEITDKWENKGVESVTVIYHDKVTKDFDVIHWEAFGMGILKNCHKIKVRVNFK